MSLIESNVVREAYIQSELYRNVDDKSGLKDFPRYTGDASFVEDFGGRRRMESCVRLEEASCEGKSPNRSGSTLTSQQMADIKYISAPVDNSRRNLTGYEGNTSERNCLTLTPLRVEDVEYILNAIDNSNRSSSSLTPLQTADLKYLSAPGDNSYRGVDEAYTNVVEFKDVPTQNYSVGQTYQPQIGHDVGSSAINSYNDQRFYSHGSDRFGKLQTSDSDVIPRDVMRTQISNCATPKVYGQRFPTQRSNGGPFEAHTLEDISKVGMMLCNRELWEKFHKHVTEMIVTKHGRRMFPVLEFSMTGLQPAKMYNVYIDVILADTHHWKFQNSKWIPVGEVEKLPKTSRVYLHPDSPSSGEHWMRQDIVFKKLKLTNNQNSVLGQITVNSMHKYQPRINVIEVGPCKGGDPKTLQTHCFPEHQFIAVTAYQNKAITQLKIEHNSYAKGFRSTRKSRSMVKMYKDVYGGTQPVMQDYMYAQQNYQRQMTHPGGYLPFMGDGIKAVPNGDADRYYPNDDYSTTSVRPEYSPAQQYTYSPMTFQMPEIKPEVTSNTSSGYQNYNIQTEQNSPNLYDILESWLSPHLESKIQYPAF